MFLDAPSALFALGGVPTDLVRAGEPRFRRRPERLDAVAAERVGARPRTTLLGRLLHPAAS